MATNDKTPVIKSTAKTTTKTAAAKTTTTTKKTAAPKAETKIEKPATGYKKPGSVAAIKPSAKSDDSTKVIPIATPTAAKPETVAQTAPKSAAKMQELKGALLAAAQVRIQNTFPKTVKNATDLKYIGVALTGAKKELQKFELGNQCFYLDAAGLVWFKKVGQKRIFPAKSPVTATK